MDKIAVVLLQLGTPESLSRRSVARFIRLFLNDPLVINMPGILRTPLVSLLIAPLRSGVALKRYRQSWDPEFGSPLLYHTAELANRLDREIGSGFHVIAAYQYSQPDLKHQLERLSRERFTSLILIPMYPQSAPSTTGSVRVQTERELAKWPVKPSITWITPLWNLPGYLELLANQISLYKPREYDCVIFSYHGLPLKQAKLGYAEACETMTAQLVNKLSIRENQYQMAYQSRFGRGWTAPMTDQVIDRILSEGARSLLIVAPSFTADCLETCWEIGISFRDRFLAGGGQKFEWVRSLNAEPAWVEWLSSIISSQTGNLAEGND